VPAAKPQNPLPLWLITAALIGAAAVSMLTSQGTSTTAIPYSQFEQLLNDGKVTKVVVAGDNITGTLSEKLPDGHDNFSTVQVPPDLAATLEKHKVAFSAVSGTSTFGTLLSWVLPPLLFVGVWMLASRAMGGGRGGMGGLGGGLLSIGRSRAKLVAETDVKVTFADVAGVDEAKEELHEIVDFLKKPERVHPARRTHPKRHPAGRPARHRQDAAGARGGRRGRGAVLLHQRRGVRRDVRRRRRGPRARPVRAGAQILPCIIFIDELDALGRARGAGTMGGGRTRRSRRSTSCWLELDGFDRSVAIVYVGGDQPAGDPRSRRCCAPGGSTARCWSTGPTRRDASRSCASTCARAEAGDDVDPWRDRRADAGLHRRRSRQSRQRGGAAGDAARGGLDRDGDFTGAVERIVAGLEKRIAHPDPEGAQASSRITRWVMRWWRWPFRAADAVQKVSIIPRGIGALGYTMQRPTEDRFLMSRQELEDKMAVLMGGRAAEQLGDDVSTGASDDLAKATDIARGMVLRFGMDAALGPVAWDTEQGNFLQQQGNFWQRRHYSEQTANAIDMAVRAHLDAALERALDILRSNRAALDAGAAALLAHETLTADEIPRPIPVETL
jgi:cell division protease FtsH